MKGWRHGWFACLLIAPQAYAFILSQWTRRMMANDRIILRTISSSDLADVAKIPLAHEALLSPSRARFIRQNRVQMSGKLLMTSHKDKNATLKKNIKAMGKRKSSRKNGKQLTTSNASNTKRPKGMTLSYNVTIQALRAYHAQHGDLVMPRRYIVPVDEAYPKEWHGLDLSSTVYDMKWWQFHIKQRSERVVELSQLGFCWQRLQPEWNIVLEALITYSSIYGDTLVPYEFVVPSGNKEWPTATWNIPLGNCVYRIRARNDFLRDPQSAASRRDQLEGLGFVWDAQEYRFKKFYVALRIFAHLEKSGQYLRDHIEPLRVPSTFVVPESSEWPEDLWGYPLGAKCVAVRQQEIYIKNNPERQKLLNDLGFHWGGNAELGWLKVVHAAAIYSKLHNRKLEVPFTFRVPPRPEHDGGDWPWPEYLWGLPLGQRLKDIRLRGAYLKGDAAEKRKRQLDALGFNWKPKRGRRPKSTTVK